MNKLEGPQIERRGDDGPRAHAARRRGLLAGAAAIAVLALPAAAHAATLAPK